MLEGPDETKVKEVIEIQTKAPQPQPQSIEIRIGIPQVETTTTTTKATTLVQETSSFTQVTKEFQEQMPVVTEGATSLHMTTVRMRKEEEQAPFELRIQLPPQEGQVIDQVTEATRTTTQEIKSIPIVETPHPEERHTETIEIVQTQPQIVEFPITLPTSSVEVSKQVETTKPAAQRIEIEIQETMLKREPQAQELEVPIGKISRADIEVSAPLITSQTSRPKEEQLEETRETFLKQQLHPGTEDVKMTQPVYLQDEEETKKMDDSQIEAPVSETIETERETLEMTTVSSEVELVSEEAKKPDEIEVVKEDMEIQISRDQIPTEEQLIEMTFTTSVTDEITEDQTETTEEQIIVDQQVSTEEKVIPSQAESTDISIVPSEVGFTVTGDTPEEIQKVKVEIPFTLPPETISAEEMEIQMAVQQPSEISEITEEKELEADKPIDEQIAEMTEIIVVPFSGSEADQTIEIPTEVELTVETKKVEETQGTCDQDISIIQSEEVVHLETQIPAPEQESKVEDVTADISGEIVFKVDVPQKEVGQLSEEPSQEITLDIQMTEEEILKPDVIDEQIEVQLSIQPEETEVTSMELTVDSTPAEVTIIEDASEEKMETETHRDEITFQLPGKTQPLEETVIVVDTQAPVLQQVSILGRVKRQQWFLSLHIQI